MPSWNVVVVICLAVVETAINTQDNIIIICTQCEYSLDTFRDLLRTYSDIMQKYINKHLLSFFSFKKQTQRSMVVELLQYLSKQDAFFENIHIL